MAVVVKPGTNFTIAERRQKIAEILVHDPHKTRTQIARMLGVSRYTVAQDIKALTEELNMRTMEDIMLHRERILREIRKQKLECQDRLRRCTNPTQGARWQQEWTNLLEKECKILGMFMPEKIIDASQKKEKTITKAERDAAVNAIFESEIIDVTPLPKGGKKHLEIGPA